MGILSNLDLLSVGIVVAATGVLGFTVYFHDRTSVSNKAFLLFSLITALWGACTYAEYQVHPELGIWFLRLSLFLAVWQAYSLYRFFAVFPEKELLFSKWHSYLLIPAVGTTSILCLTPYVLNHVTKLNPDGSIAAIQNGVAIPVFGIVSISLVIAGLVHFVRKGLKAQGADRRPYLEILAGTFLTFALIISFNFILPAFFDNAKFVSFGSVFVFPFVAFAAYAVLRERFFSIKVATTATLVFILAIVSFGEIIFSNSLVLILFRTSIFILVLVYGINLIRSVLREVEQRERIQKLAEELAATNRRQESLMHFVSHEVKNFLAKDINVFSLLQEGEFGVIPDTAKTIISRALLQAQDGSRSVKDILKASNQKTGTVTYKNETFDLKQAVSELVEKLRPIATEKGLVLNLSMSDGSYGLKGDKDELADHVFRNLIENAINYTPSGSIEVSLRQEQGKLIFAVKDSGIGITEEDKRHLFTEGGRGKDSVKVNVHSTGYGLFIAKNIVEAHRGVISAASEGAGKGSTFKVELPVT